MRLPALLVALVLLTGCDTSSSNVTAELTLTNAADRSIVAVVHSRESLAVIDLADALRADEFDAAALAVGETARRAPSEYDVDEDLVVFVYARRDEPTPRIEERYGPGAAELVTSLNVSRAELRSSGYRIVVRDVSRGM